MRMVICFIVVAVMSTVAWGGTQVLLYNQGFAFVQESRTVDLGSQGSLLIADLPQTLLHDSLLVEGLTLLRMSPVVSPGVADGEQTEPFLERLVGRFVDVYAGGEVIRGRLLAAAEGVVLLTEGGQVFLRTYDKVLAASPEGATVQVDYLASPGQRELTLSYLARRMRWSAVYSAILEGDELFLQGQARLENQSGRSYSDAQVQLVAGDVDSPQVPEVAFRQVVGLGFDMAVAPDVAPAFEYHRYSLQQPVELQEGTTFVPLVTVSGPYERVYRFTDGPVRVLVKFKTPDDPLPGGQVRVFDEGGRLYVGSASIGHTPAGETVELSVGSAFDLTGERVQVRRERPSADLFRDTYRVSLRSAKDDAVTVEVVQHLSGTWTLTEASDPYEVVDAQRIRFLVDVPAGGSAEVTYTVEWRY